MPKMTLVVTAHRTPHLAEALESVRAQTTKDFDLVLVADISSGERVTPIFEKFAASYRSTEAVLIELHAGSSGVTRNAGFNATKTEWVAYLDGDDVLSPIALETMIRIAERNVADVLSSGLWYILESGNSLEIPSSLTYLPEEHLYRVDPESWGHSPFLFQFSAIKKVVWERYPYYAGGPGGDDLDFVLHHLLDSRFRKVARALYGLRRTPDGASQRSRSRNLVCTCPCSLRYQRDYYTQFLSDIELDQFENFHGDSRVIYD